MGGVFTSYDNELIAGKLRRWENYLSNYRLPAWEEIPDFGLYMEQVLSYMKEKLDYLPPELKEEQFITAATINNYVRRRLMPEPVKKKYYRVHLAYLIVILSLKQSLSIPTLSAILPTGIEEKEVARIYTDYVHYHRIVCLYFIDQVRKGAAGILGMDTANYSTNIETPQLIMILAVGSGFSRLLSEKLLLLNDKTLEDGGSIEIEEK